MVRSILLSLLASGVIPVTLADTVTTNSTEIALSQQAAENRNIENSSCILPAESTKCLSSDISKANSSEIYPKLWFQNISEFLLSGSMFSACKTTRQNILLATTKKFRDSGCIFSWQKPLEQVANISDTPNSVVEYGRRNVLKERKGKAENTYLASACPTSEGMSFGTPTCKIAKPQHSSTRSTILAQTPIKFPKLSRSSLIVSLPTADSTFTPQNSKLANPAPETKRIASPFGWRRRPYSYQLQFHQGVDYGAPLGSPVVAVGDGIVTRVVSGCYDFGNLFCGGQLGNWIEIDHGNGILGVYGHLKNSSITIEEGMKVWKNQEIAEVGSSGWSTGAHLDFRLKVNGKYEDPAQYLTPPKLAKANE